MSKAHYNITTSNKTTSALQLEINLIEHGNLFRTWQIFSPAGFDWHIFRLSDEYFTDPRYQGLSSRPGARILGT